MENKGSQQVFVYLEHRSDPPIDKHCTQDRLKNISEHLRSFKQFYISVVQFEVSPKRVHHVLIHVPLLHLLLLLPLLPPVFFVLHLLWGHEWLLMRFLEEEYVLVDTPENEEFGEEVIFGEE